MCGLYGVYTNTLSNKEREDGYMLGLLNLPRGTDSSGITVGYREKGIKLNTLRSVAPCTELFKSPNVRELVNKGGAFMLMGHNRAATIGGINLENAHPVTEGSIIGTHNGTCNSLSKEAESLKISDTRLLFRMINEMGVEKAVNEIGMLDAFALVWVNQRERTFNMVRNSMRPLHLMFSKSTTTIWWSSEARSLRWVSQGSGDNCDTPFELDENTILQFELGTTKNQEVPLTIKRREWFPQGFGKHDRVPDSTGATFGKRDWEDDVPPWHPKEPAIIDYSPVDKNASRLAAERAAAVKNVRPVIKLPAGKRVYRGFEGVPIKIHRAKEILDKGCKYCGQIRDLEETVFFISEKSYVCGEDCYDDPLCKEWLGSVEVWRGSVENASNSRM